MIKNEQQFSLLCQNFLDKDRKALSQSITLMENQQPSQQAFAKIFLKQLPKTQNKTLTLAVSGPPGVGKSTFINALGQIIVQNNLSLAILPIDPSSPLSYGSILADKVRMADLLNLQKVYIRPSPSKGLSGGLSPSTFLVMQVVKAFGFDVIIIETVGVGQSEYLAYGLSDFLITLVQPGSGDFWQSIKKGILELSDFIVINKADGIQKDLAQSMYSIFADKTNKVHKISSLTGDGIKEFWQSLPKAMDKDFLNDRKEKRFIRFFNSCVENILAEKVMPQLKNHHDYNKIIQKVLSENVSLNDEVEKLLHKVLNK